jgi:hypothetical protein
MAIKTEASQRLIFHSDRGGNTPVKNSNVSSYKIITKYELEKGTVVTMRWLRAFLRH